MTSKLTRVISGNNNDNNKNNDNKNLINKMPYSYNFKCAGKVRQKKTSIQGSVTCVQTNMHHHRY